MRRTEREQTSDISLCIDSVLREGVVVGRTNSEDRAEVAFGRLQQECLMFLDDRCRSVKNLCSVYDRPRACYALDSYSAAGSRDVLPFRRRKFSYNHSCPGEIVPVRPLRNDLLISSG